MVFVDTFEEFAKAAESLFEASPKQTRYVTKYRHCDGKLELKVTDDRVVVKYCTDQAQDVKKLEKLNNNMMRHMMSK